MSTHSLANALPDAIFILSKDKKIIWLNQAANKLFQCGQVIPDHIFDIFPQDIIEDAWCHKGEVFETKQAIKYKRIAVSIRDFEDDQCLLIARDISHLHHLERMRQDFVANVSHELRTPLTVVHGYLEILNNMQKESVQKNMLNQMQQQSHRMQTIIEDLLYLSSLENAEHDVVDREAVDVPLILNAVIEDAQELSQKKHHFKVNIDATLKINGIAKELHSLFSNLVLNAVKYTPSDGLISIAWFAENDSSIFSVKDTGIGLDKKHIHRVTERFYRVDKGRSSETGGTGLGLAIVKHILIHHNAELEIESKLGEGSEFRCLFTR